MVCPKTAWLNYVVLSGGIVCSGRSHALMLPLHEAIGFGEVELLLIATAGVVCVAAVAVAHDQRFQVRWKLSARDSWYGPQTSLMTLPRFFVTNELQSEWISYVESLILMLEPGYPPSRIAGQTED